MKNTMTNLTNLEIFLASLDLWEAYLTNCRELSRHGREIHATAILGRPLSLEAAFSWNGTPEGFEFWDKLEEEFMDFNNTLLNIEVGAND